MAKIIEVKKISDWAYQCIEEDGCDCLFLLPSGDGYSLEELSKEIKIIEEYKKATATIYSGIDYEGIPFNLIYKIWGWEPSQIPSDLKYNCYDHGFIAVIC
jgi:hypothetical protein